MKTSQAVGIVLGFVAAVLYGSGDYFGGRAAADVDVRRVLMVSQATAMAAMGIAVFVVHGEPVCADIARGAAAGLLTPLGLGLLYRALAIGRASVVAPLCAVVGSTVPVTWGLVTGERPGATAMVGVAVAVCAAALIARSPDDEVREETGVLIAMASGLVLGSSFICFAAIGDDSGLWPILSARVVAVTVVGISLLVMSSREKVDGASQVAKGWVQFAVLAGIFDVSGTVALVLGLREELAILVAALASLAPGFTVACAWLFQRERVSRIQLGGVALALVGLALIAAR